MMRRTRRSGTFPSVVLTAAGFLLLAGCSSSQDDTTEDAAETSPTVSGETTAAQEPQDEVTLTVTFDGDTCMYDGPTEIPQGAVRLTLVNDSNRTTFVEMAKLKGDVTFEDVTAFHSPEPREGARPDNLYAPLEVDQAQAYAGDDGSISDVVEAGEYALVCLQQGNANALAWVARPGGVSVTK
jgi:hypothetical protein